MGAVGVKLFESVFQNGAVAIDSVLRAPAHRSPAERSVDGGRARAGVLGEGWFRVVRVIGDWSLGAHQLQYIYETYDGTSEGAQEVIEEIKNGKLDLKSYDRMEGFLDMFDILKKYPLNNY